MFCEYCGVEKNGSLFCKMCGNKGMVGDGET